MSRRYKQKRRRRYYRQKMVCHCGKPGNECRIEPWATQPDEILCGEHARQGGYCTGCFLFWAGVSAFDFNSAGLCPNCQDEVDADFGNDSDDDSFYEDRPYCETCGNLGVINCHCGGDLCVCENQGEYPCPDCG